MELLIVVLPVRLVGGAVFALVIAPAHKGEVEGVQLPGGIEEGLPVVEAVQALLRQGDRPVDEAVPDMVQGLHPLLRVGGIVGEGGHVRHAAAVVAAVRNHPVLGEPGAGLPPLHRVVIQDALRRHAPLQNQIPDDVRRVEGGDHQELRRRVRQGLIEGENLQLRQGVEVLPLLSGVVVAEAGGRRAVFIFQHSRRQHGLQGGGTEVDPPAVSQPRRRGGKIFIQRHDAPPSAPTRSGSSPPAWQWSGPAAAGWPGCRAGPSATARAGCGPSSGP